MKTKYFIFAAIAAVGLASCSSDEFLGDNSPNVIEETTDNGAIRFGFELPNTTRADIYGPAAADLLGNHFYVTGTKGTESEYYPTDKLVFDNYLVRYTANTAGTTESNTANWEYVGVVPETAPDANYVKLGSYLTGDSHSGQTIKYWDYSVPQYDFFAFSTGKDMKAVNYDDIDLADVKNDEIGVTAMLYGEDLDVETSVPVAYKFFIPSVAAIEKTFITDITEVGKTNYSKEVTLRFKNLGSKVRVALYETVPGYAVKDVVFYTEDGTTNFGDDKGIPAALISADANGLPTRGTIEVKFQHVGNHYAGEADYDKASTNVTPVTTSSVTFKEFGELDNFASTKEGDEADDDYLGRTLPTATFAGSSAASYYQTVFPVSDSSPLTLRVDYTLVSIDGSEEEINVYGAKAVVPSTYTVWLPNYAYTYIFKITDNTNGWTNPDQATDNDPAGLFPITFDAVVAEATDANAEQTTITTVATPSITTYQQNHNPNTNGDFTPANEYSKATGKNIYVQVWDNGASTPALVTNLSNSNSLLYSLDASHLNATEAQVMDALQKRTAFYDASATSITGRNGITLTKKAIDNTVTQIVNGVDDNPIELGSTAGKAAMINITATGENALAAGTYAYVYDYTTTNRGETYDVNEFQPIVLSEGKVGVSGKSYKQLAISALTTQANTASNFTADESPSVSGEAVDNAYIYFSVTTNGTGITTYSYVSVAGKDRVPAGLLKYPKASVSTSVAGGSDGDASLYIYFDTYFTNTGSYAVKVIKVVD